jgi:hypothetical protein
MFKKGGSMLFPGEKEAIEQVLRYGQQYGYGNLIAHLKKEWAEMLVKKWGISEESAISATNVSPYPLEVDN